jgi:acetolactate synthase I/III small subunit
MQVIDRKIGGNVIGLTVHNHAGVMSHITNLFARRAFNLEGILCGPIGDGSLSKMYLLVNEQLRLDQVLKQLEKLYDVIEVTLLDDFNTEIFHRLPDLYSKGASMYATSMND